MSGWVDLGLAWDPKPAPAPVPTGAKTCMACGSAEYHANGYCHTCYERVRKGMPPIGALFTCEGCGASYTLGKARTRTHCASCQSKRTRKQAPQPFCEISLG